MYLGLYQRGVATLAISLIILFLVTIVTLYTANTSVLEQKVSANQYRSDQAFSAANAGEEAIPNNSTVKSPQCSKDLVFIASCLLFKSSLFLCLSTFLQDCIRARRVLLGVNFLKILIFK